MLHARLSYKYLTTEYLGAALSHGLQLILAEIGWQLMTDYQCLTGTGDHPALAPNC